MRHGAVCASHSNLLPYFRCGCGGGQPPERAEIALLVERLTLLLPSPVVVVRHAVVLAHAAVIVLGQQEKVCQH